MSLKKLLNKNFLKLAKTNTPDTVGGWSKGWSEEAGSEFKGYIEQLSAKEQVTDARKKYTSTHRLFFEASVSLNNYERIRNNDENKDYRVVTVENLRGHHQEALLMEVTS